MDDLKIRIIVHPANPRFVVPVGYKLSEIVVKTRDNGYDGKNLEIVFEAILEPDNGQ